MAEACDRPKWVVELRSRSTHYFTWRGYAANQGAACKAARRAYACAWKLRARTPESCPGAKAVARETQIRDGILFWQSEAAMERLALQQWPGRQRIAADTPAIRPALEAVLWSDPAAAAERLKASALIERDNGTRRISAAFSFGDGNREPELTEATALAAMLAFWSCGHDGIRVSVGFDEEASATLRAARRRALEHETEGTVRTFFGRLGFPQVAEAIALQAAARRGGRDAA